METSWPNSTIDGNHLAWIFADGHAANLSLRGNGWRKFDSNHPPTVRRISLLFSLPGGDRVGQFLTNIQNFRKKLDSSDRTGSRRFARVYPSASAGNEFWARHIARNVALEASPRPRGRPPRASREAGTAIRREGDSIE
jgi:hypothetical protein